MRRAARGVLPQVSLAVVPVAALPKHEMLPVGPGVARRRCPAPAGQPLELIVLASHAKMARELAVAARAALVSAAGCAWVPVARTGREGARWTAPVVKTQACRKLTGPIAKTQAYQAPLALAGLPTLEAVAASKRLPSTTEVAPLENFRCRKWEQKRCQGQSLRLLHSGCRNAGWQQAMRHIERRRGWASVTSSLAFH